MPDGSKRETPLFLYDGDCSFCKFWVDYFLSLTGDQIEYLPFAQAPEEISGILTQPSPAAAVFVDGDGSASAGAEAICRLLAYASEKRWLLWCYEHVPGFASLSRSFYETVAKHRGGLYHLARIFWGKRLAYPRFSLTRSLFLRGLGIIYLIAFVSWFVQIPGLIGSHGILPAERLLASIPKESGLRRYFFVPTLFWLHPTDAFLRSLAAAGIALSLPVVAGIAAGPCLLLLWALYLSQVSIGQEFMAFQWDILLLEAGFLAIFFAPWRLTLRKAPQASPVFVWLYRWLVFRVYFLSGVVKLLSGDPSWRNLTALSFHYETQPLPNVIAWYMYQLPLWFQKFSTLCVFAVELIAPFFIIAPRKLRHAAAFVMIGLQTLIFLTGNYCFFNLLTALLCIFLFDDAALQRISSRFIRGRAIITPAKVPKIGRSFAVALLATVILLASAARFAGSIGIQVPEFAASFAGPLEPFYIANSYGLFAVMTTTRPEIIVEGSDDGERWLPYQFRYKPGDLSRAPRWVAPHQPRLDWQMWFAALGNYRSNPWFVNFVVRLLEGTPEVLTLMDGNPFPAGPPRYVRALVYDYRFTSWAEKKSTGRWWKREGPEVYLPPVSLK